MLPPRRSWWGPRYWLTQAALAIIAIYILNRIYERDLVSATLIAAAVFALGGLARYLLLRYAEKQLPPRPPDREPEP